MQCITRPDGSSLILMSHVFFYCSPAFQGRSVRNSSSLALLKNTEFLGETCKKHEKHIPIDFARSRVLEFYTEV